MQQLGDGGRQRIGRVLSLRSGGGLDSALSEPPVSSCRMVMYMVIFVFPVLTFRDIDIVRLWLPSGQPSRELTRGRGGSHLKELLWVYVIGYCVKDPGVSLSLWLPSVRASYDVTEPPSWLEQYKRMFSLVIRE